MFSLLLVSLLLLVSMVLWAVLLLLAFLLLLTFLLLMASLLLLASLPILRPYFVAAVIFMYRLSNETNQAITQSDYIYRTVIFFCCRITGKSNIGLANSRNYRTIEYWIKASI